MLRMKPEPAHAQLPTGVYREAEKLNEEDNQRATNLPDTLIQTSSAEPAENKVC